MTIWLKILVIIDLFSHKSVAITLSHCMLLYTLPLHVKWIQRTKPLGFSPYQWNIFALMVTPWECSRRIQLKPFAFKKQKKKESSFFTHTPNHSCLLTVNCRTVQTNSLTKHLMSALYFLTDFMVSEITTNCLVSQTCTEIAAHLFSTIHKSAAERECNHVGGNTSTLCIVLWFL